MGAALKIDIHGEKGGSSSPKSPTEASDSLRSTNLAKLLIAVGEGEFEGTPTAADIYLDNTPINDASGNVNFQNVKWEWRTGSVDQPYVPGIPSIDNETTVNVELRNDSPWVRSITNTQLSAVRVRLAWPALQKQDDNGVGGYRIEYAIDVATDGGSYKEALLEAVDGKTTTRYERSRRIDLPTATSGWQIRVRRLTANQNTNKIADTMLVAGLTEVIDAKLRYPNTALLYIEFDAEQFTNIPAVTVKCKARKWQVPSNYDPFNRTYSGVWDGSMKEAWTNNPAWVTYGVCTQDRFGLGKRIKPWMVDKWELYRIAQYCDQDVPNGFGGVEPRFLCDMNLQGKANAWSLLRDISGIYRGMTYWAQGQLVAQADMPRSQDFDYVFTRANVIDGKFTYGSASAKTRYTRAIVGYDNPDNNYDTDVIPFADPVLQRRFGDKPTELTAIGCTRASEAQRRGKWVVMSNNQDRTVSFSTGMEGAIPLPGYIIPVADSLLAGREIGGRIAGAAGRVLTLDRDTLAKAGDRLIVNLPSGQAEGRTVQSVAGRAITVTVAYSETPTTQLQWALDADDLAIPLYRVLSVKRTAEGEYAITALQYEPSKFAYIDTGARLEERPISVIPITVVPSPASVSLASTTAIAQGLAVTTMTISWPAVAGAVAYDAEWRKDSGNWIKVQRTGSTSVDITGIYAGAYLARVRAVSAYDISSSWRNSILTQLKGKEGLPPAVTSLSAASLIFGIKLNWTFPAGVEDTQRTEIWYGPTTDLAKATKLSDLAYPQSEHVMQSLKAGVTFFFWARLVDRTGNIGPWYPAGIGVMGQTSSDAGPVLDLLDKQLTESQFGEHLLGRLDLIDGDGPGSVNERLEELKANIGEITDALVYVPTDAYVRDNTVRVGDNLWTAIASVPAASDGSNGPPNPAYWVNTGQSIRSANAQAAQVSKNTADISTVDGKTTATATQLQAVQAQYRSDSVEGDLLEALKGWDSTASYAQEVKVRTEQDFAQAQRTTLLDARVGGTESKISIVETAQATDREATTQQITNLTATVTTNQTTVQAALQSEAVTRSNADGALSTRIETAQAKANDATVAVQQTTSALATTNNKLAGIWSVRMELTQNNIPYAAGFGLGLESGAAGTTSQFVVRADTFLVMNTSSQSPQSLFGITGGQTFIRSAFIEDGSISWLKVGNLQSSDYVANLSGWAFPKTGPWQLNGSMADGRRSTISNSSIKMYHANGVLGIDLSL
ncbi:phage tail protein [Pseudomonas syringae]|uniref:phage tail protein n=1 Tax=Pseudomonas syringae TaxID=317 RepID=UPI001F10C408|nr:phage tail protein [Pseudomonas syringae]MCH5555694.1 phage tail protein [Pseudomonas syringae pv. syringae]MCH5576322.1 phage tail protein [Pseudomonas syringae pv. syringae]MCH5668461.1 phage tail protein [Pseudomonas syringae pv. syringae]